VVAAFGDSITDGSHSTPNANLRWPDQFSARAIHNGLDVSVVNAGIAGSQWYGQDAEWGRRGVVRFPDEVLGVMGITDAIILLGINDLLMPLVDPSLAPATAEQIISAMQSAITQAKAKNVKVHLATILPWKGYVPPERFGETEAMRQRINAWIRANKDVASVIDFDNAVQDPTDPQSIRAGFQSDALHPNDAGCAAMAAAINLAAFK
jgi:lysophospholipase L1-like esterase